MKKMIYCCIFPFFLCQCATIKHEETNKTQFGFGAKMRIDFSGDKNTNYQISVTGGAAQSILWNSTTLFYQPSLIVYQGGLGNKSTYKDINKLRFEIVNSFGTTIGYRQLMAKNTEGVTPHALINLSVSNASALQNSYAYSLTLSSNFIWSNARNADSVRQVQRVGFGSVSIPHFSFGYANDGPPFQWRFLPLGDVYDRYWTGRGFAQFDIELPIKNEQFINASKWQFTFEYDRFTGFLRDNYELAHKLGLRFVPYGTESAWNKGRWTISALNKNYNVGFLLAFYNENRKDLQNLIHRKYRYPYHNNTYKQQKSFGFLYEFQNKINQK
jgi:hypothetical protein